MPKGLKPSGAFGLSPRPLPDLSQTALGRTARFTAGARITGSRPVVFAPVLFVGTRMRGEETELDIGKVEIRSNAR